MLCSYYHTQELIKGGASRDEMKLLLDGAFSEVDSEKVLALTFAQHYADAGGAYDKSVFTKVVDHYGKDTAYGIMAATKLIMVGSLNGISLGNLWDRIRFRKPAHAKLLTDLNNGLFAYLLLNHSHVST